MADFVTRRLTADYVMLDAAGGKVLITVSGIGALGVAQQIIAAVGELTAAASDVMSLLRDHGPAIVPHLMDSDQNAGQRLRDAIARAEGRADG